LVLGRGGDATLDREVVEEGDNLRPTHLVGVALAVKEDVAFGPVEVGLLGADAVVLAADEVAHFPEQLGAANDFVRIHGDVSIAAGSFGGVHAQCSNSQCVAEIGTAEGLGRGRKRDEQPIST
jgi:hypothetical protein